MARAKKKPTNCFSEQFLKSMIEKALPRIKNLSTEDNVLDTISSEILQVRLFEHGLILDIHNGNITDVTIDDGDKFGEFIENYVPNAQLIDIAVSRLFESKIEEYLGKVVNGKLNLGRGMATFVKDVIEDRISNIVEEKLERNRNKISDLIQEKLRDIIESDSELLKKLEND